MVHGFRVKGLWFRVEGLGCGVWGLGFRPARRALAGPPHTAGYEWSSLIERVFFIDKLLARIHFIFAMIRWTGLAPWKFEFPIPGSLTSAFLASLITHKGKSIGPYGRQGRRDIGGFLRTRRRKIG